MRTGYWILTSNTEKAKLLFLSQREKFSEWKGKNKLSLAGEKKHKIGENTLWRLPDLISIFKSPGPFCILISAAKVQQSKCLQCVWLLIKK